MEALIWMLLFLFLLGLLLFYIVKGAVKAGPSGVRSGKASGSPGGKNHEKGERVTVLLFAFRESAGRSHGFLHAKSPLFFSPRQGKRSVTLPSFSEKITPHGCAAFSF